MLIRRITRHPASRGAIVGVHFADSVTFDGRGEWRQQAFGVDLRGTPHSLPMRGANCTNELSGAQPGMQPMDELL